MNVQTPIQQPTQPGPLPVQIQCGTPKPPHWPKHHPPHHKHEK